MAETIMNPEKDPGKRGFGWKRIHQVSEGTKEEQVLLKNILHDYQDLKHYCQFFETKRRSIIIMAGLEEENTTFLNTEKLHELMKLSLNEDDKRMLFAYFDACTKIMIVDVGMEGLPDGMYREIAFDRYFGGLSYKQLMEKYKVNHKTVQRGLTRVRNYLAEYVRWYMELAKTASVK